MDIWMDTDGYPNILIGYSETVKPVYNDHL